LLFFLILDSSSFSRRLATAAGQRAQLVEALTGFALPPASTSSSPPYSG
jgi:hypothetical protein